MNGGITPDGRGRGHGRENAVAAEAIPRRETKLLSRKLLVRFGGLSRVFQADPARLEEVEGVGPHAATLISLVRPLTARFLKDSRGTKVHPRSIADVCAYFLAKLKGLGDAAETLPRQIMTGSSRRR